MKSLQADLDILLMLKTYKGLFLPGHTLNELINEQKTKN